MTREQRRRCLRTRGPQTNDLAKLDYLKFLGLLGYEAVEVLGMTNVAITMNDPSDRRPSNLSKIEKDEKQRQPYASFVRDEWFKCQREAIGKEKPFTGKDNGLLYGFIRQYRDKRTMGALVRAYWKQGKEEGRFVSNFTEFYNQAARLSTELSEEQEYEERQEKLTQKRSAPKKVLTAREQIVALLERYERDGNDKLVAVQQRILEQYDEEN